MFDKVVQALLASILSLAISLFCPKASMTSNGSHLWASLGWTVDYRWKTNWGVGRTVSAQIMEQLQGRCQKCGCHPLCYGLSSPVPGTQLWVGITTFKDYLHARQ